MAVTKEQISGTILALREAGKPFGPTHIRTELGEGSLSTISKYRQEFLEDEARAAEPPDPVTDEVIALVRTLLSDHAEGPKAKELQDKLRDATATTKELEKECARIEILLEEARAELTKEKSAHETNDERLKSRVAQLTDQLQEARNQVSQLQATGHAHAQQTADLHRAVAEAERAHSARVDELHAEILSLSAAKEQVKAAQADADKLKNERERDSADLADLRHEIKELKADLKDERAKTDKERAELEAARAEIADLRVKLAKAGK